LYFTINKVLGEIYINNMKKINYIYFVFDTLNNEHVEKSIESFSSQDLNLVDTITIYNNSSTFESNYVESLFNKFQKNTNIFDKKTNKLPSSKRIVDDVNYIINNVVDSNLYFLHKADFCLPVNLIKKSFNFFENKSSPHFVNFSKYFMREDIVGKKIDDLLKYEKFSDLLNLDYVAKSDKEKNYSFKHRLIGYTGIDGGMHMYNEEARKKLFFHDFTSPSTWSINSQNIKMIHGVDDLYIFHMFHYVGRDENRYTDRGKIGHRF